MKPPIYSPPLTVLRCSTSADFLSTLPIMMGYTVRNSVVIALFQDNQARSAMRCDLPDASMPHLHTEIDHKIISLIHRIPDITSVAIVIYTDETFSEIGEAPRLMLAKWLERSLEQSGIPVKDLCCVAADAWANYHEKEAHGAGRLLDEIETSNMSFEARQSIDAPLQDITDLGALPAQNRSIRDDLERAFASHIQNVPEHLNDFTIANTIRPIATVLNDGVNKDTAEDCARFAHTASHPSTWLVALITTAVGAAGARRVLRSTDDRTVAELLHIPARSTAESRWSIAEMITMFSSERIEHEHLRNVIATLSKLAAHTPEKHRVGVLSLLAWAWWVGGMSSPATLQIEEALALDATSELALMMREVNDTGPPLWIFSEER